MRKKGLKRPTPTAARLSILHASRPRVMFLAPALVPPSPAMQQVVYYEDELCVVIYDGFPKAQYHLLLLAKASKGSDLASVPPEC